MENHAKKVTSSKSTTKRLLDDTISVQKVEDLLTKHLVIDEDTLAAENYRTMKTLAKEFQKSE